MKIEAIKTRPMVPPADDLFEVLKEALPKNIPEKSVVAVTSKVVAIWEGRVIEAKSVSGKDELVAKVADKWLPRSEVPNERVTHTITDGMLISTAGIDKSNSGEYYVFLPEKPDESAEKIRNWLKETYNVSEIGVVITDSRSLPLRRGAIGFSIGYAGFEPLRDYRGKPDIFGRELKGSVSNVVDALATAAVFTMGEGEECTPIAVITDIPHIVFSEKFNPNDDTLVLKVPLEEDVYYPFLKRAPWREKDDA